MSKYILLKRVSVVPMALAISLIALLSIKDSAKANLLAYEGFAYDAGTGITNASDATPGDSFGWAARWGGANNPFATNFAGSLGYQDLAGNILPTDGGSLRVGNREGYNGLFNVNAQPSRTLAAPLVGGTYWVSFLAQWVGYPSSQSSSNLYWRKGDLAFRTNAAALATGTGSEILEVGRPNANQVPGTPIDTWTLWEGVDGSASQAATAVLSTNPLNNVTFVLMKLVLDGTAAPDTVSVWFNPTNIAISPDITGQLPNGIATFTNLDNINNLRFDANNANASGTNTVMQVDEIRIFTDFADLMTPAPEPTTACLLGLGGLLLISRWKRKSSG